MSDSGSASEDEEQTISTDLVVTKYKMAADISNRALEAVAKKCLKDVAILDICEFGDKFLMDETSKVFKKEKELKKGIAFPTCISVNNCVCHYSPLKSEAGSCLSDGDLVKIDLGAHIDGFAAVASHSIVVGASKENKVTGRKADVMLAAHHGIEAALRLLKPGTENFTVTDTVQKIAESYQCKPVEGMLSHQLKKHVIDGEKVVIQNPNEAQRADVEKINFEVHEVYGVDVLVSSGEGKAREQETRTTVYKRHDIVYQLKMKTSRQFFSDVDKTFGVMAFSLRTCDDEKKAKMGVIECVKHDLMKPFPVLFERDGEYVAQFKYTVLIMPNGPMKITGLPFDEDLYESEHRIEDEKIKALLATSGRINPSKKKKKKAKKHMAASCSSALTDNAVAAIASVAAGAGQPTSDSVPTLDQQQQQQQPKPPTQNMQTLTI